MDHQKCIVPLLGRVWFRGRGAKALLITLLSCIPLSVSGQEITGSILGTVKDPTGAVVSGATITIFNTDRNVLIRTVTSDATGEYVAQLSQRRFDCGVQSPARHV
jgi:hypothetical protein